MWSFPGWYPENTYVFFWKLTFGCFCWGWISWVKLPLGPQEEPSSGLIDQKPGPGFQGRQDKATRHHTMVFLETCRNFATVDGRNPAPPGMYKTHVNDGINYLSTGAGFLPSTVSQRISLRITPQTAQFLVEKSLKKMATAGFPHTKVTPCLAEKWFPPCIYLYTIHSLKLT